MFLFFSRRRRRVLRRGPSRGTFRRFNVLRSNFHVAFGGTSTPTERSSAGVEKDISVHVPSPLSPVPARLRRREDARGSLRRARAGHPPVSRAVRRRGRGAPRPDARLPSRRIRFGKRPRRAHALGPRRSFGPAGRARRAARFFAVDRLPGPRVGRHARFPRKRARAPDGTTRRHDSDAR